MKNKILFRALSLLLLFSTVLGLSACGNTDYFYCNARMDRYVALSADEVLGLALELELPFDEYTEEEALRELEHQRLIYATYDPKTGAADAHSGTPGYGDTAYIFFELSEDAAFSNIVTSNFYSPEGARSVLIGYWQFKEDLDEYLALFDNETVSDALMTATPADRRTDGTVGESDNVRVTYKVTDKDGKTLFSYNRRRVDLARAEMYDAELVSLLIGAPVGVEQKKTVENAEMGSLTYTFTVEFVAEETYTEIAVDLPSDAFGDQYREEMQALNGKRVYLRVSLDAYVDFTVPALDRAFLTESLKFDLANVADADLITTATDLQMKRMENERLPEIKEMAMLTLLDRLSEIAVIKKYPEKLYREQVIATVDEITAEYWKAKQAAVDGKYKFNVTLDQYAAIALEYKQTEYPSLQDYALANAEKVIGDRLILFAVADICGDRITKKELNELYEEYVDSLTESAIKTLVPQYLSLYMEKHKLTEEKALEKLGGEEGVKKSIIEERGGYQKMRESVVVSYGGREDLLWYTLLNVTYGATKDHIFAHNTWNYKYVGEPKDEEP